MPVKSPPFKRLYESMVVSESGCWEWTGLLGSSGYGHIKAFGKFVGVHRLSFELYNGPIPAGAEIRHRCDNPVCINPDHLEIGSHLQNMRDMIDRGRRVQGKPNPRKGDKNKQSKPVMVLGKPYGSMKEAEQALGYSSGSVSYWIKNKPSKAVFLTREQYEELKHGITE